MRRSFWQRGRAAYAGVRALGGMLHRAVRPDPSAIAHFSMTRAERWFYFHIMERLLAPLPWIVWRTPAACIATIRTCYERHTDALALELLTALGQPAGRTARWRFRWQHWYLEELDRFLLIQGDKLSPAWARRHVRIVGELPPEGAILIGPHQMLRRLGTLRLAGIARPFGGITGRPAVAEEFDRLDVTQRHVFTRQQQLNRRILSGGHFSATSFAIRDALNLLRVGGYVNSVIDRNSWYPPRTAILGHWLMVFHTGTIWLARHSGRPIVPYVVIAQGRKLTLWIGPPIEPSERAIGAAIEECIRRAPVSWSRTVAMAWLQAPRADEPPA